MSHEWWSTFSAHFLAILLGGLKVMVVGWLLTWFIRKKYLGKFMVSLMQDVMKQLNPPPEPVHAGVDAPEPFAVVHPIMKPPTPEEILARYIRIWEQVEKVAPNAPEPVKAKLFEALQYSYLPTAQ